MQPLHLCLIFSFLLFITPISTGYHHRASYILSSIVQAIARLKQAKEAVHTQRRLQENRSYQVDYSNPKRSRSRHQGSSPEAFRTCHNPDPRWQVDASHHIVDAHLKHSLDARIEAAIAAVPTAFDLQNALNNLVTKSQFDQQAIKHDSAIKLLPSKLHFDQKTGTIEAAVKSLPGAVSLDAHFKTVNTNIKVIPTTPLKKDVQELTKVANTLATKSELDDVIKKLFDKEHLATKLAKIESAVAALPSKEDIVREVATNTTAVNSLPDKTFLLSELKKIHDVLNDLLTQSSLTDGIEQITTSVAEILQNNTFVANLTMLRQLSPSCQQHHISIQSLDISLPLCLPCQPCPTSTMNLAEFIQKSHNSYLNTLSPPR